MKTLIIIPARYGSTRLPGKPLALISGKTLLSRVVDVAKETARRQPNVQVIVATDDPRIEAHCRELQVQSVMTDPECATGTDRVLAAAKKLSERPDFVLNLQGDAPFTPPDFLEALIEHTKKVPHLEMVTPVCRLSWEELDKLRENKKKTPFSGTTAIVDNEGRALWFSKGVLPQIRDEEKWRKKGPQSPVFGHIGLYGYTIPFLEQYVKWPMGHYEALEGLEQLRVLENGGSIHAVIVDYKGRPRMSGVDSPEDVVRAEKVIAEHALS
jgi:3-deoxy-manno-octulosonate cytidylyltransferase (CMP-KDO synthetase)